MLKNALKRCQATPMVSTRPTTSSQTMPDNSLTSAVIDTAIGLLNSRWPMGLLTKFAQFGAFSMPLETLNAFTPRMPRPSMMTTASTK